MPRYGNLSILGFIVALSTLWNGLGCQGTSQCSKLNFVPCQPRDVRLCGCFDFSMISGGPGGFIEPSQYRDFREAIVIRPDSTVEYYSNDTLRWQSTFTVKANPFDDRNLTLILNAHREHIIVSFGHDDLVLMNPYILDGTNRHFVRQR